MLTVNIRPNEAGQRFDKFIKKFLPEAPNSFLYRMLRKKNITLNGKKAEGREQLAAGDEVQFFFSEETLEKFGHNSGAARGDGAGASAASLARACRTAFQTLKGIAVLYEDDHVLILNKPAGILTQKAGDGDMSLNEWMIGFLLETGGIREAELSTFRPSVCNRLDRNTSGLVLCGKSLAGSQSVSALLRDRVVKKLYLTIVKGVLTQPQTLDGYLSKDKSTNRAEVFLSEGTEARSGAFAAACRIRTAYCPIGQGHSPLGEPLTCLEVDLITGKTHQIRAHLAMTGHPVIGDGKYGDKSLNREFSNTFGLAHQLLHASRLEFPELSGPLAGLSGRTVAAPLPERFQGLLKRCFPDLSGKKYGG